MTLEASLSFFFFFKSFQRNVEMYEKYLQLKPQSLFCRQPVLYVANSQFRNKQFLFFCFWNIRFKTNKSIGSLEKYLLELYTRTAIHVSCHKLVLLLLLLQMEWEVVIFYFYFCFAVSVRTFTVETFFWLSKSLVCVKISHSETVHFSVRI